MDWMAILREFGVPTLYAVILLVYFLKLQDALRCEVQEALAKLQETVGGLSAKCDQILTALEGADDDHKAIGTVTQEQVEVLNTISERIRDIFSYFINLLKRGGDNDAA